MKKVFLILSAAFLVIALAACTKDEIVPPDDGNGTDTTHVTPPPPEHNSLYQTTWAGSTTQSINVPIIGSVSITVDNTVQFVDDSNATSYLNFEAASLYSRDSTVACTYTWEDPNGVLTAKENAQMSIAFNKVNDNTINITIRKEDITTMWPAMGNVASYLPESFSIDLIKQE